jgi:hypothetical protein
MPFIQAFQRLVERESLIQIRVIRVGQIQFPEFLCHSIEGNLNPAVAFAVHLGITVSEYPNQPALHRLQVAQTGPRSISLKECFLCQLFGIRPGAGPPIGNSVKEPVVLSHPSIESLIADLHCRCGSPEPFSRLSRKREPIYFIFSVVKMEISICNRMLLKRQGMSGLCDRCAIHPPFPDSHSGPE